MSVDSTDTATRQNASRSGAGRAGNIALWTLQVLLALGFAFSGFAKFAGEATVVQMFDTIGWGDWFRYFTGVVEIAGAIGLLIPRMTGLAALGLVGVMVGALITHAAIGGNPVAAIVLAVLAGVVAWGRRGRTTELVSAFASR